MKTVYIGMSLDVIHHGHINIIEIGRSYGQLTVGLLTEKALANNKRLPLLNWQNRKRILENINGVHAVVEQDEWDYAPNIRRYRPDFMIHGTDWLEGPLAPYRAKAIEALNEYGGKLIEIPYTRDVNTTQMYREMMQNASTPDIRRAQLKRSLENKPFLRFLEAHSPLSALIAENANSVRNGIEIEYDGFWSSSLTDSTNNGKPDIEALDFSARLNAINSIFDVSYKPLIMDGDTGGKIEHFPFYVKSVERLGISAIIIEDKTGLKKNSLLGNDVSQEQADPAFFCEKIAAGCAARTSNDFMIFARIESLILDKGIGDALQRGLKYTEAGADGIMIHSRKKDPEEVFTFARNFQAHYPKTPLIVVPTTFNKTTDTELADAGFNIAIYANHMLRAAYPAMQRTAQSILAHGRTHEVEQDLISINEILNLIPGTA